MTNFEFLKNIDKNLYEIISEAEKLYRDEYFEQSIAQTRRFGEAICKIILGEKALGMSFDGMLSTLKDKAINSVQEKEFIDDLYFLKKEGNFSVHATKVKKDGITALKCLQSSFEIALNYVVYYKKYNSDLLKSEYDTELLITGKKNKKSLSEQYQKTKIKQKHKHKKTSKNVSYKEKKESKFFIFFISISAIISLILVLTIYLLTIMS